MKTTTTKESLLRRMRVIDASMASASMMRGADAPVCVRLWGIAQDALCRAEEAIASVDLAEASDAMDAAREAMRDHAGMVRAIARVRAAAGASAD